MATIIPFPVGGFHRRTRGGLIAVGSVVELTLAELAWDQLLRTHAEYRKEKTPEARARRRRAVAVYLRYCRREVPNGPATASA